jgi:serine/threonine protein kinase/Flp pilus assembly protein TadD
MDALVCPLCRIALLARGGTARFDALTAVEDVSAAVCPRDGKTGVAVTLWPVPAGLRERFSVLEPFAHGDGGSMYLADEPETGRRGVLKILAPAPKDQLSERQRLRRELVKQSTLARSHLVVPLACGETEGVSWLFREWLDGVSLEVRLSREGALPQTEALAIAAQVASALDELHRGGLLHRDVKPGHIFLQPSPHGIPRALLLDAGVTSPVMERVHTAVLEDAVERALRDAHDSREPTRAITDSQGQVVFGSAGYVSPEQLLGKLISFRSDLYSLGCTLYRMLTGRHAFAGETVAATLSAQRYGELPPLPSDLPNGIGALLRSILSKDPQQRPFSAQKLRRTLDPYLPDGALMEKQETSTYEAVPQGTTTAGQPPQASGTLRPPGPTSAHPGPVVRASAPPAPPRSMPPPPPPQAMRRREETTQQIDLGQIEEVRQQQKRTNSSVPPPTPKSAASVPPPTPGAAAVPPPSRLSDKTQPLRLEQILQVASAQKAASVPPARQPEPPKELLTPPAQPKPGSATAHGLGTPPSPVARTMMGMAAPPPPAATVAPIAPPEPELPPAIHTAPGIAGLEQQPLFSVLDEPLDEAEAQPPSANMFDAAALPKPPMKATLMGMGNGPSSPRNGQHSLDVTLERGAQANVEAGSTRDPSIDTTLERQPPRPRLADSLRPSARPPVREPSFDQHDETASLTMPASTLGGLSTRLFADRRKAMYAGGAIVGVGVLSVLASALFSSEPPMVANRASEPQPVVAAAPAALPEPVAEPVAAAPKPTVVPIVPAVPSEPAPSADPGTPRVQALAPPPKEEPSAEAAPREERHHHRHHRERELATSTPSTSKRDVESAPKASSKSAKTAVADKSNDKSKQFEAARDEARAAYSAKNYKAAAAAYEKASKLDPKHPGTFAGLGSARLQLGDNKAAVAAYQRAVQLSPDTSGFHAALGRAYLANGDRTKAVASYKKAISLDPKNDAAKAALAQLGG